MRLDDLPKAYEISQRADSLRNVIATLEPKQDSDIVLVQVAMINRADDGPHQERVAAQLMVGPVLRMCKHQLQDCEKSLADFGITL